MKSRAAWRLATQSDMVTQMTVTNTVRQCRAILEMHYGARFRGLVLFGSVARDQAAPASDIDLLVLLSGPFAYAQELRQIVDLLYPVQLDTDQLISAIPAPAEEFDAGSIQLYRNAKREGILV
ncbi:MAG: hypothetical protein A2Y76_07780 [Planctomycetes bacterium RBG_13_60_9]|nr:MAG: hypothetical protein A2Y76_07780 [Planctomycetes bacterium RBG_13_60_9]